MNHKPYMFIPTGFEVVWNLTLGFFMLLAINGSKLFAYYTNKEQLIGTDTSLFSFGFLDSLDNRITATVVTFLFWALVGLIAYIIGSVAISMITDAGSGTKAFRNYVFPNEAVRRKFMLLSINHILLRIVGCIALVLWLVFIFTRILPICSVFFYSGLTYELNWTALSLAVLSVITLALYLYLLSPILRLIVLRPRVLGSN